MPAGMIQAEGGATLSRADDLHATTIGETLIRIGVAQSLELRVEPLTLTAVTAQGERLASGLEDAAVGIKTPLYRRGASASPLLPDLSLLVATSLPTGARDLRADGAEPEAKLAAQWELSPAVDVGANLTARRGRESGEGYWERGATASLGLTLSERAGSYVEWYAIRDGRESSARQVVNGGLTWKLSDDFQIDARAGKATREAGGFVGLGMATRW